MNKDTERLIAALRETFTEDDIIKDGATDWQIDNLIDTINDSAINDDEPSKYDEENIYDTPLWYYTYGGKWSTLQAAEKLEAQICNMIDAAHPESPEKVAALQSALDDAREAQFLLTNNDRAQTLIKEAESKLSAIA